MLSTIGPQNYLRNDIILYQNWFVIVRLRWFRNNRQVLLKLFYIKIDVVGTFPIKSTSLDKRLVFFFGSFLKQTFRPCSRQKIPTILKVKVSTLR